jgi:hypothetical protein
VAEFCIICGKFEDEPCLPAGPRIAPKKKSTKEEIAERFGISPDQIMVGDNPLEAEMIALGMDLIKLSYDWALAGKPNEVEIDRISTEVRAKLEANSEGPLDRAYVDLARDGIGRITSMINEAMAKQAAEQGEPKTLTEALAAAVEAADRLVEASKGTEQAGSHDDPVAQHIFSQMRDFGDNEEFLDFDDDDDDEPETTKKTIVEIEVFDLSHEEARVYNYPSDGNFESVTVEVEEPAKLFVREGGDTHYVETKDGYGVVIRSGWTHIDVMPHQGESPFKF